MDWSNLVAELDQWAAAGRAATLWWRDDDAVAPTARLDRLLALSAEFDVPAALAVIPEGAVPGLGTRLARCGVRVLQHGWSHCNRAPADAKASEFGPHRPQAERLDELARGRDRLGALLGDSVLPVLVPPWNRMDRALLPALAGLDFKGVSAFAARASRSPAPGLMQTNCHVDLVDWRGTRGFRGDETVLHALISHLRGRRTQQVDAEEPTGVLGHHLVHDQGCWRFLGELFAHTTRHPAVRWLDAAEAVLGA